MDSITATQLKREWAKAEARNAKIVKAQLKHLKRPASSIKNNVAALRQHNYDYAVALCDCDGAKPIEPSTFFVDYGDSTYGIPTTHVVSSLNSAPLLDAWAPRRKAKDAAKSREFAVPSKDVIDYHNDARASNGCRRVCWFKSNSIRWKRLPEHGTSEAQRVALLPEEACALEWKTPGGRDSKTARAAARNPCGADDVQVNTYFKDSVHGYAPIDVFAKYIGHEALMGGADGAPLLLRYFLRVPFDAGSGLPIMYPKDDDLFARTRTKLLATFQNIYLVYPAPVEPVCGPAGEVYALGEFERAAERKRSPTPCSVAHVARVQNALGESEEVRIDDLANTSLAGLFAPQPVILAGFSPTRDDHYKTCTHHERDAHEGDRLASGRLYAQRCFPLHGNAVVVIKQCLGHYDLKTEFPMLATLHPLRDTEPLNFAALRERARAHLGPPPMPGATLRDDDSATVRDLWLSNAWKEARSLLPFEPPWVVPATPAGCSVPLHTVCHKNSAMERNGSAWRDLDAFGLPTDASERARVADVDSHWAHRHQHHKLGRPALPPDFDRDKELNRRRLALVDCVPPALLPDKLLPAALRKHRAHDDDGPADGPADGASKKRAAPSSSAMAEHAKKLARDNEQLSSQLAMARSAIRNLQGAQSAAGDSPLASPHLRAIGA